MPSTYTTNLGIEKIETGTQSGTWGDTTNTNLDLIDEAIGHCFDEEEWVHVKELIKFLSMIL